jgi:hypothetical protein
MIVFDADYIVFHDDSIELQINAHASQVGIIVL